MTQCYSCNTRINDPLYSVCDECGLHAHYECAANDLWEDVAAGNCPNCDHIPYTLRLTNADEAIEALDAAVAYQKAHPITRHYLGKSDRSKIVIHTSGWIVRPMLTIGIQAAREYIRKGFKEGEETLNRYINGDTPSLLEGNVVCIICVGRHWITLNMTEENIVRTEESQAKQDSLKAAREVIFE